MLFDTNIANQKVDDKNIIENIKSNTANCLIYRKELEKLEILEDLQRIYNKIK